MAMNDFAFQISLLIFSTFTQINARAQPGYVPYPRLYQVILSLLSLVHACGHLFLASQLHVVAVQEYFLGMLCVCRKHDRGTKTSICRVSVDIVLHTDKKLFTSRQEQYTQCISHSGNQYSKVTFVCYSRHNGMLHIARHCDSDIFTCKVIKQCNEACI